MTAKSDLTTTAYHDTNAGKWSSIEIGSILYSDDKWMLEDGYKGKLSTNGTWYRLLKNDRLFVDDLYGIKDGMVFKAGQTLYSLKITPPQL